MPRPWGRLGALALLLTAAAALTAAPAVNEVLPPVASTHWISDHDPHFRKYSKRYFGPHFDWRWFKAQAIAESRLRPEALSDVGARGVMQLMPATFEEIRRENPQFVDLDEPRWNIAAGIFYDRMLCRRWRGLAELDRLYLAFASYNAGYARVRAAYRRAEEPVRSWEEVEPFTPGQTRHYVRTIQALMEERPRTRLRGIARLLQEAEG